MATSKKRDPKEVTDATPVRKTAPAPRDNTGEMREILSELVDVMTPLCAGAARDRLAALRARLDAL